MKILYQGFPGAYSHLAAQEVFPRSKVLSCSTFEDCFKLCSENKELKCIIPVENSIAGRVADIQYLMNKYKLQISAEHFQLVSHNLISNKNTNLKKIKSVRSHSQAISQCNKIISKYKFSTIVAADTAGSAKFISENKSKNEAAIASSLAAKIYNLKILKKNIEDESGNVTRFLIMSKNKSQPNFGKKKYITSCIFKVKNKPAALYKCLGGFATNNVNLSKLESFSDKNSFEQYLFLCDIYGHIEDIKVQKSLEELGFHTVSLDILGVYEASKFRKIK
ncbi:MAG: prephenate dehydratase [Candidatus Pelagibacter sp. TMED275]|nr:MAG: prephenate dehydratase [Candidatus Pelagibacter sp. TMED275]|tara:strand:+ start:5224 stop:6057 length:834 start_codon:yes stop_codon:yes gene_type:complete